MDRFEDMFAQGHIRCKNELRVMPEPTESYKISFAFFSRSRLLFILKPWTKSACKAPRLRS